MIYFLLLLISITLFISDKLINFNQIAVTYTSSHNLIIKISNISANKKQHLSVIRNDKNETDYSQKLYYYGAYVMSYTGEQYTCCEKINKQHDYIEGK